MTPSEFKLLFPAFTAELDARVQLFIDRADPYFDVARWGGFYQDGLANFVAHGLSVANNQAAQGAASLSGAGVVSKRVGEVSVSMDAGTVSKQADDPYMKTSYGQRYRQLAKMVGRGALAA